MSIVASLAQATGPSSAPAAGESGAAGLLTYALGFGWTGLAVMLALRLGVLRPATVVGPARLAGRHGWGLLGTFFGGVLVWMTAQVAYLAYVQAKHTPPGTTAPTDLQSLLAPIDLAILSTVPPALALVALLLGDRYVGSDVTRDLGATGVRGIRAGVGAGVLGMLVVGPVVWWTMFASEAVYQRVRFQHPSEHELLNGLGRATDPGSRLLILAGAALMAPLFEELLFRGHLQTLLRHMLIRLTTRGGPDPEFAADRPRGKPWQAWLAIVLTSMLFAVAHPAWTWPAIFVLSLGFGYVYERTGNLWASVTVHLLFNSISTALFLFQTRAH